MQAIWALCWGIYFFFFNLPWEARHTGKAEVQSRPSDVFKELVLCDDFHTSIIHEGKEFLKKDASNALIKTQNALV